MARLPRLSIAGCPQLVLQRGNNGQPVFADDADRGRYLALLSEAASRFKVAVHAYVLLDNHVHLLLTPSDSTGLAQTMQSLGRAYVRYFNDRHGRSGTLWEGRYRSAPLEGLRYLLPCLVWLDTHAVRAGLSAEPAAYPWSSHGYYAGHRADRLLTPPEAYWALGNTPFARELAYADLVRAGLDAPLERAFARFAQGGWPMGGAAFAAELAQRAGRRTERGRAGRPKKNPKPSSD